MPTESPLRIGVLALQGAFEEHVNLLKGLNAEVKEVRLPDQFEGLDGIVLPGGESTAMALIGERWGVFPRLREWVKSGRPVWGTCAGMILLSNAALMQKAGGQALVGGLDVEICRNYFGSQIDSHERAIETIVDEDTKDLELSDPNKPFPAVFIRAPAILSVQGDDIIVLAKVRASPCAEARRLLLGEAEGKVRSAEVNESLVMETSKDKAAAAKNGTKDIISETAAMVDGGGGDEERAAKKRRLEPFLASMNSEEEVPTVIVAARKANILVTAFHPELTGDNRWHAYFLRMVSKAKELNNFSVAGAATSEATAS